MIDGSVSDKSRWIKTTALEIGFDKVGIANARALPAEHYRHWLSQGYHGSLSYLNAHVAERHDPRRLVPGTLSVISVALNYYHSEPQTALRARISRYAWGEDYHRILKKRLQRLYRAIAERFDRIAGRFFVDTAPILEKQWAVRSGIGWQGKNCIVITPEYGSWIFLGELLLNIELEADTPAVDRCGDCRKCLDACPTGALIAPYQIDASRCLSYFTVEYREKEFPPWVKDKIGDRLFGCDICQQVCPWNNKYATLSSEPRFAPKPAQMISDIQETLTWSEAEFKRRFQKSPVLRCGYAGFQRNLMALKKTDPQT